MGRYLFVNCFLLTYKTHPGILLSTKFQHTSDKPTKACCKTFNTLLTNLRKRVAKPSTRFRKSCKSVSQEFQHASARVTKACRKSFNTLPQKFQKRVAKPSTRLAASFHAVKTRWVDLSRNLLNNLLLW